VSFVRSGEVATTRPLPDAQWRGTVAETPPEVITRPRAARVTPLLLPEREAPDRRSRRRLLLAGLQILVLAISALVIYLLVRKVVASPGGIATPGRVSWGLVAFAIVLNVPTTLLRALRSHLLLERVGQHVPFLRLNGVNLAGQTLSWITPAATGDLSRPYFWRNRDDVPVSVGVAVVVYERIVTLLQLGVVGGVLAAVVYLPAAAALGLGAAGVVALAAPWWVSLLTRRFLPPTAAQGRHGVVGGIFRSLTRLEEMGVSARLTALFAACTLLVFLVSGLQVVVLAWSIGATAGLGVAIGAYCISQVAGSVSTLPFGIGASDAVMVGLLVAAGTLRLDALAITVLVRVAMTLPLGIAGAGGIVALGRPRIPSEAELATPLP
jgi:uncharacterized membrane protein YbhN (UPF0104 family)